MKPLTFAESQLIENENLPFDWDLYFLMIKPNQEPTCVGCDRSKPYVVIGLCPLHYAEWDKNIKAFERLHWDQNRDRAYDAE